MLRIPIIPLPRGQSLIAFAMVAVVKGGGGGRHFVIKGSLGVGQLSLLNLIIFQTGHHAIDKLTGGFTCGNLYQ